MDSVLGTTAGHTLEMIETLDYLTGKGVRDARLHEVVIALAAEMLLLGGLVPNLEEGRDEAQQAPIPAAPPKSFRAWSRRSVDRMISSSSPART